MGVDFAKLSTADLNSWRSAVSMNFRNELKMLSEMSSDLLWKADFSTLHAALESYETLRAELEGRN